MPAFAPSLPKRHFDGKLITRNAARSFDKWHELAKGEIALIWLGIQASMVIKEGPACGSGKYRSRGRFHIQRVCGIHDATSRSAFSSQSP